jgi:PGDYG protein
MSDRESLLAMFEGSDVLRVRNRPLSVSVEIAEMAGVCETLEGPVSYQAGDAIVSGVRKERWPVRRDVFSATYEPVLPTRRWKNGT